MPAIRGILFDEDAAEDVARRLRDSGYDAVVTRERYAGEDDDEDHPWAVITDAPAITLDLLLEAHDGWLDEGPQVPDRVPPPLDLPRAPRTRHREED